MLPYYWERQEKMSTFSGNVSIHKNVNKSSKECIFFIYSRFTGETTNVSFAIFRTFFIYSHLFSIQRLRTNSYVSFLFFFLSFASFTLSCFVFASERYSWIIVFCELFRWKCVSVHLPIANTYNYKIMFFLCILSSFHIVSIFFVCSSCGGMNRPRRCMLSGSFSKLSNLSNCHFVSAPESNTFYSLN